jgi:hypothetical protein
MVFKTMAMRRIFGTKGAQYEEDGYNCIITSFKIFTSRQMLLW